MKKVFIDDIKVRKDFVPGPGKFERATSIGEGVSYSMAARLPTEKQQLDKSRKLPGPGLYELPAITGQNMTTSNFRTQSKFSFGKAVDRFNVPTKKVAAPAPGVYKPLNNFNENFNSTFVKHA